MVSKLKLVTNKVRPEVDEDVDNEHNIHYEVHNVERRARINTVVHVCIVL